MRAAGIATGTCCEHVSDRIVWVIVQPRLENLHGLVDFPSVQCARASSRRASGSFGLSVMTFENREPLPRPLLRVQQYTEVVVRVRVFGSYANRGAIGRFGFGDLSLRPEHHTEILCAFAWFGSSAIRADMRRSHRPA